MRKESIIVVIIVVIILIVNIITQKYTKETVENLDNKLEELKTDMQEENIDNEKVKNKNDFIMSEWKKKYEKLAYFIEHDELEKVETELTTLKSYIETEEYEEGIPEIDRSIFILNHIKDKFKLNLKNIF